jgi:hypothetical protein
MQESMSQYLKCLTPHIFNYAILLKRSSTDTPSLILPMSIRKARYVCNKVIYFLVPLLLPLLNACLFNKDRLIAKAKIISIKLRIDTDPRGLVALIRNVILVAITTACCTFFIKENKRLYYSNLSKLTPVNTTVTSNKTA